MKRNIVLKLLSIAVCLTLFAACSSNTVASSTHSNLSPSSSTIDSAVTEPTAAIGNEVGNLAPAFELPLHGGGTVSLKELRGKPVLLNFFATWCGPCMAEMPDIQKIHEEYSDTIHVLCVSIGETSETVEEFLADGNYSFPVAMDIETITAEPYSLTGIPQTYVLDSAGVITSHHPGSSGKEYEIFSAHLDALL